MTQINRGDLIRVTYQDGDRTLWVEGVADRFTIVTARPWGCSEWAQYIRTENCGWYPVTYYTYPQNWGDLEVKDDD
jgi:hypothetical protein